MSSTSVKPKIRPFRFRHSSRSLKFSTGMALETNKEKMEKIISFNLLPIKLCYSLKEVNLKNNIESSSIKMKSFFSGCISLENK